MDRIQITTNYAAKYFSVKLKCLVNLVADFTLVCYYALKTLFRHFPIYITGRLEFKDVRQYTYFTLKTDFFLLYE